MNLSTFKTNFNGGTRANRFRVKGAVGKIGTAVDHNFHIVSSFIPDVNHMVFDVNAFGRKLFIPGDREYLPWSITVLDDIGTTTGANGANPSHMWKLFSTWHNNINAHTTNIPEGANDTAHLAYKQNWAIEQLSLNGDTVIKSFSLMGCWPRIVGDIDLNMARRNILNKFNVIMVYDSIEIAGVTPT